MNRDGIRDIRDEDWTYTANEGVPWGYFTNLDYLLSRLGGVSNVHVLGVVKQPDSEVSSEAWPNFRFRGYDLLDQDHDTSALTNCGGFSDVFQAAELSTNGLVPNFNRAVEIQRDLKRRYPKEHHADCNIWAVFQWQRPA